MKKIFFGLSLFMAFSLGSCIQDEPLNSECDIEQVSVVSENQDVLFFSPHDAVKIVPSASSNIVFYVREGFTDSTALEALRLDMKITPGATIWPTSDSIVNLRDREVVYTVTSEDGLWHRDYRVRFAHTPSLETDLQFENFRVEERGRYEEWFERTDEGTLINQWATGNPGYAISRSSAVLGEYPTVAYDADAMSGHAVKLTTCDTGDFGSMMSMPIAAGNLFIGTFDVANALLDAMAATRFGLPFNQKPLRFQGYYKYHPGDVFINRKGTVQPGRIDEPDLYAVLYKNTDDHGLPFTLEGDNVLTHPNIVALARVNDRVHIPDGVEMKDAEWTYFDIPFEYNKELDEDVLKTNGYNLSVVFTSSIEGATFCGAVGSTLLVDEVKVVCEE